MLASGGDPAARKSIMDSLREGCAFDLDSSMTIASTSSPSALTSLPMMGERGTMRELELLARGLAAKKSMTESLRDFTLGWSRSSSPVSPISSSALALARAGRGTMSEFDVLLLRMGDSPMSPPLADRVKED